MSWIRTLQRAGMAGIAAIGTAWSQDLTKLPPAANGTVDFSEIAGIFERSCLQCHGAEKPKGRFRLDNAEMALKGGSSGVAIIPGDSAKSPLVHYISGLVEDMQMPPPGKGEPLTAAEIGKVRAWIDQGAVWGKPTAGSQFQFSITPSFRFVQVDGDARKFREVEGIREGISLGVSEFSLREQIDARTLFTSEGRFLPEDNDFLWKLNLEKSDLGFIRGGFEQYRRWYDDSGGYNTGPGPSVFDLNRDLHIDVSRLWTEIGLTLPDKLEVVLGYEYLLKEGDKSTLQWGPVGLLPVVFPRSNAKHIYPSFKELSEQSHILTLDLRHNINGWYLEDNARVEFYSLESRRENVLLHTLGPSPERYKIYQEEHDQISGANTFSIEKQVNDWLFVSGGHHYSQSGADATFDQSTVDFRYSPVMGEQYLASPIVFDTRNHAFSLASAITPVPLLTFSAAVQSEWYRQNGVGAGDLRRGNPSLGIFFPDPVSFWANLDRHTIRENVGIRFSGIPFTVVYAEARLTQEETARQDEQVGSANAFMRNTDAELDGKDFKVGFNTSPWSRVSFTANARHHEKENDYNHIVDITVSAYPAFLRARDSVSDHLEGKLSVRPINWMRVGLSYQNISTDYQTTTDSLITSTTAEILSSEQDANVYSVHLVLNPWRRMYFSSTLSWSDTRTWSFAQGSPTVVPYAGDVYTVLSTATYALSTNTDLHLSNLYSAANYLQFNSTGLASGIDFERKGFEVGITRRFKKGIKTNLRYGYYDYVEGGAGSLNDYEAHAIFATLTMAWP